MTRSFFKIIPAVFVFAASFLFSASSASAATLFSDGFESGNFSVWSSTSGNWSTVNSPALVGAYNAKVIGSPDEESLPSSILSKQVSTLGYTSITLSYQYKVAGALESSDHLYVEWSADGSTWTTLTDYSGASTGVGNASFTLPVGAADNANFAIRFRAQMNSANTDDFRLDDVSVAGTLIQIVPPVECPPGMMGIFPACMPIMPILPDLCPNISGTQSTIPSGMMLSDGLCITIPVEETPSAPTPTPPTTGGTGTSNFDYWGCIDTAALNFNSLANKDDGSCKYPTPPVSEGTTTESLGEVLGASTTTSELPPPASCVEHPYLTDFLKFGKKNDPEQVKLLQNFLNETMDAKLPVTGIYGRLTKAAVKKFQVKYHDEIIKPWIDAGYKGNDLEGGSGYVYKTTLRYINMLKCREKTISLEDLKLREEV